jgi:hypothetical protein
MGQGCVSALITTSEGADGGLLNHTTWLQRRTLESSEDDHCQITTLGRKSKVIASSASIIKVGRNNQINTSRGKQWRHVHLENQLPPLNRAPISSGLTRISTPKSFRFYLRLRTCIFAKPL